MCVCYSEDRRLLYIYVLLFTFILLIFLTFRGNELAITAFRRARHLSAA
jgi:hypothetical protein